MTLFWIIAAALTLLALVFVVVPLLRPAPEHDGPDQDTLNIEVFRRRLAELDADLAAGALDRDRYDAAKKDLERELLYDLGDAATDSPAQTASAPQVQSKGTQSKGKGKGKRKGGKATPAPAAKPAPDRSPILAILLAVALPVAAAATYLHLGDAEIIPRLAAAQRGAHGTTMGAGGQDLPPMDVLADQLAAKMEQHPDNLEGWLMLGRTYFAVNQPQKALGALERAYKLAPTDPTVLITYAEAIAANNGNRLTGRPAELIRAALKVDPHNPSGRWLDGMRAYQEDRFAEAAATWQGILGEMNPAGEEAGDLREMIAEARSQAGGEQAAPAVTAATGPASEPAQASPTPGAADEQAPATTGPVIEVSVSLDPSLADKVSPGDSLFVYARAVDGPPMPLAAQRLHASDLPTKVTLDDSMAMMPAMRLSAFPKVTVGARLSKTGQAMPASGDLEGSVSPVSTADSTAVSVVIDQVRP